MDNTDNAMNSFNTKRKCPNCRGELMMWPIASADELKKHGILDPWTWYAWDTRIFGRLYEMEIESEGGNSSSTNNSGDNELDILLSMIGRTFADNFNKYARSHNVRLCEKCNRVWDIFDETAFVLNSNNQELIQKYISLIEEDIPSGFSKEDKELNWRRNLIKARLYQYQYKNQNDSQRNDDYNYHQLYLNALRDAEKYHTDNQNFLSYEYELKAGMCDDDDILQRFYYLNAALISDISTHRKTKIQNNIGEIYSAVLERWKEPISVDKRRIIFIANNLDDIAGFYEPTNSINLYFTIDKIPSSIKFPYGRPKGNELYIAHSVNPDEYIPYEGHEELLFMDKIRELRRLLRYLGATEITFTSIKGKSIEEIQREGQKVSVDGGFLGHEASVSRSSDEQQKQMSSMEHKVDFIEVLNPYKYPSIPENLHWYDSDPEWKDIVEARLHSDERLFIQEISTKQVSSLSEQSQLDVNAAYKNLISHINVNYHSDRGSHGKKSEETKWRITAKFKPLSEFENKVNVTSGKANTSSPNEQKYLDLIKKSCANGEISDLNRRMLERIRIKLSISEERASELEASLIPQLSEEEKEYLDAVREYLADGTIGENEREMLQTLRELNNISEERAKELEAMA